MANPFIDIAGIRIGHFTDNQALTGCTVIICEHGAVCGVDVRGGAPGTREISALNPLGLVKKVNAILLTGGSAFGLASADGVMRFLAEKGHGFDTKIKKVPIVPGAVIFDFHLGDPNASPGSDDGYQACVNAYNGDDNHTGNIGVGTGATIGKVCGAQNAMRGGLGAASIKFNNGLVIGALIAVNSFGDVHDCENNNIIAGARSNDGRFVDTIKYLMAGNTIHPFNCENTTIGVVGTNADFDKAGMTKIAQIAQTGLTQVVSPAHTMFDGDTIFAFSNGHVKADLNFAGIIAAEMVKKAIINAVKSAKSYGNTLSWSDMRKQDIK